MNTATDSSMNFDLLVGNLTALAERLRGVEEHAIAQYTPTASDKWILIEENSTDPDFRI